MATQTMMEPLLVIVGPTASGKSSLAMELARLYGGELICADSRTIYVGMDIGTAKPTDTERKEITHHMLDVVTPDQPYSAAKFKVGALACIKDISARGKLPIMVGGSGLYIDSVIFDFAFLPESSPDDREYLNSLSVKELQVEVLSRGLVLPENSQNPRHLIRTIETNGAIPVKKGLRANTLIIGLDREKSEVLESIHRRIKNMMRNGLASEVNSLVEKYGWDSPGMQSVGYQEWQRYDSEEQIISAIEINTARYAKRQRTWFKRNGQIIWVKNITEATRQINNFLQ